MVAGFKPVVCRSVWLGAILTLSSGPALAFGEDYYTSDKVYDDKGKWTVSVNTTRKSCMMHMSYDDDTVIEVGGDNSEGEFTYFFMFGNEDWAYKEDEEYGVITKYDRRVTWTGDGIGVKVNDYKGVAIEGVKEEAVEDFAASSRLNLKIGGRDYGNYSLSGTQKGLSTMRDCIAAVEDGSISLKAIDEGYQAGASPTPGDDDEQKPAARPDDGKKSDDEATYSYGTGFFVNGDGYLLTNAHVVEGCKDAMVRQGHSDVQPATIVAREVTNDLAILKVAEKSPVFGKFRGAPQIRLGDSIVVFGYPLAGMLSSTGNLTTGLISSLTGAGDDVSKLQISAPVQSGNSGGAVVDQSGRIVGVVVAKANIQTRGTEEKPDVEVIQNVNFAIKAGMAQFFLDANQIHYEAEAPGDDLKTPDVADIARSFTVQVACEMRK